jgi:hypothetical protein
LEETNINKTTTTTATTNNNINCDNEKGTYKLIDVAISGGRNVI